MNKQLHILILEDDEVDAELMMRELHKANIEFISRRVDTKEDFQRELTDFTPDIVLADYTLPSFDGFLALKMIKEKCSDVPFIFVSGTLGEDLAIETLKSGATDYVIKDRLVRLAPVVRRALSELKERIEHRQDEEALKESEMRFRSVVESAPDAIILTDSKCSIISWNKGAQTMFGYTQGEVLGKSIMQIVPERMRNSHQKKLGNISLKHNINGKTLESYGMRKDGSEFPLEISIASWKTEKEVFYGTIIRDISERKKAEEQIKASLKEKEALLKEIYHRVKNNMQIISSLLKLQSRHIKEEKYCDMFQESQNRIMAMSLIHEKLYPSKNLARIDFRNYVSDLAKSLLQSYRDPVGNIALDINVKDISIGIDSAIPCGLIINELVSNSLKHAFPDDRAGEIKIALRSAGENTIELIVSDNGVGIPENLNFRCTKSLGLHLVTILVENQLRGEINLNRSKGTEFKIKFKEMKK